METDLLELMKSCEPKILKEDQIRDIMHQTLLGLCFMHKYGFFHRDMKPENLLLTRNKLKIADFGLAREIRSVPPYTEYVSTRYYRAPECILKSTNYNSPIDIWALGCIMAEMYTHPQPLFCGSNEKEVLFRICSVLGTPTHDIWNDGIRQANIVGIKFPNCPGTELEKIIPEASSEAIDLIKQMIKWDPNKRATAKNLLNHPFFTNHIIDNYYYSSGNNDIIFGEKNFKKFSNNNDREGKDEIKRNEKESNNNISSNNESGNDNNINNFGLGDDENYGSMLNESDGFDKLLNQLKKEKIEEDRNYEKQKKAKEKEKEEEYDLNYLVDNFDNNNITNNISNKESKKEEDFNFFNRRNNDKKDSNFLNNENKINKEQNNNIKSKQNRRGNARHFLEETENYGGFNFGESPKKKNSDLNNDFNNLNLGDNGEFGSLFGNKSRRNKDKNYEI